MAAKDIFNEVGVGRYLRRSRKPVELIVASWVLTWFARQLDACVDVACGRHSMHCERSASRLSMWRSVHGPVGGNSDRESSCAVPLTCDSSRQRSRGAWRTPASVWTRHVPWVRGLRRRTGCPLAAEVCQWGRAACWDATELWTSGRDWCFHIRYSSTVHSQRQHCHARSGRACNTDRHIQLLPRDAMARCLSVCLSVGWNSAMPGPVT